MLQNFEITRFQLVGVLMRIRQEWQEAAVSASLVEVEGNVGLLLADLINGFGLTATEQMQILGDKLYQEMQDFLQPHNSN